MILVFQILLGIGIAGFLYIVLRKIPVLLNYPRRPFEEVSLKQKLFNNWKILKTKAGQSDVLHEAVIPKTEKFLRKFRVFVLKMDNLLIKIVGHLRKRTQEKEENDQNGEMPT